MNPLLILLFFFLVVNKANTQTLFIWPVKAMPSYSEVADFYATNNFLDQNNTASFRDWNCGRRTYNGHLGIDIDLWPFTWSMMDNNYVAVVAAAAGRVVSVTDNLNNENNCGQAGENTNWNFIAIRHADSSTSIYGHLRTNSAQVAVHQIVSAGQIIAFVGSSGNSSNPHLHFEVNRNAVNNSQVAGVIDPYSGTCNTINATTRWINQKPYWESAIVRVMTHGSRPSLVGYDSNSNFCQTGEVKNAKAAFVPNDSLYVGVAMRDYRQNQSFTVSVFGPTGGVWFSESNTNKSGLDIPRRYYTFDKKLPPNSDNGTYKVVVDFNGTNSVHFFSVNCPATQNVTGAVKGYQGFKASQFITTTALLNAGNRLFLQAGASISLLPGFVAANGSTFKARIRDCNYSE